MLQYFTTNYCRSPFSFAGLDGTPFQGLQKHCTPTDKPVSVTFLCYPLLYWVSLVFRAPTLSRQSLPTIPSGWFGRLPGGGFGIRLKPKNPMDHSLSYQLQLRIIALSNHLRFIALSRDTAIALKNDPKKKEST